MNPSARKASTGILILSIVLSLFVAFNGSEEKILISMLAYAVAASILVVFLNGLQRFEFGTIGGAITPDLLLGLAVGAGFIYLNTLNSAISLGTPQSFISLGAAGLFIAVVIVAPIVEEHIFRGFLQQWLYNDVTGKRNIPAILIQAAVFAVFHFAVYGGFLALSSAPGLFIGAFIFAVVAGFLVQNSKKRADVTTLERVIVAHMLFNFWLLNSVYNYVTIAI